MLIFRATRSTSLKSTLRTSQILNFSSDDKKTPPPSPVPNQKDENVIDEVPLTENVTEKKVEKTSAANKLNKLLASMQTDDHLTIGKKVVDVPIAGGGKKKKEKLKAIEKEKIEQINKKTDIIEAAKNVANMIEGDNEQKKQTESELLAKLLNQIDGGDGTTTGKHEDKKNLGEMSLNDLIVGMKIDRQKKPSNDMSSADYQMSRSQFVRNILDGKRHQQTRDEYNSQRQPDRRKKLTEPPQYTGSVDLFGSEPLGIFKKPNELKKPINLLQTWQLLQDKELNLLSSRPPRNYFEKMANWTNSNKIWKFPIDNEQGMVDESMVDFSEHIFLEQHLEDWCPNKGPIRHFMELVCVGLSKNPYISAADKKDHILWYRDYFDKKKDVLKDLMELTSITEPAKKDNKPKILTSS